MIVEDYWLDKGWITFLICEQCEINVASLCDKIENQNTQIWKRQKLHVEQTVSFYNDFFAYCIIFFFLSLSRPLTLSLSFILKNYAPPFLLFSLLKWDLTTWWLIECVIDTKKGFTERSIYVTVGLDFVWGLFKLH